MKNSIIGCALLLLIAAIPNLAAKEQSASNAPALDASADFQYQETRELVQLVNDAAELLQSQGKAAFAEFRAGGSRWRQGETYIFVLDLQGNMLVHADEAMEGKNQLQLLDINGKPIIRGIINAVTGSPAKADGWFHYQWPAPEGLLPRWKSTYVRRVEDPSGASFIVGSGIYNDRMERVFVIDLVKDAVAQIEKTGESAFQLFRDPAGPFSAKEAYVFVLDSEGREWVNPAFPNLEGRNLLNVRDSKGKHLVREMLETARTRGSGWVEYTWPRPGESAPTLKSTYISKAKLRERDLVVGCGVYLADAPETLPAISKITAPQIMSLVREGAALLRNKGESAFADFRKHGSKWFREDTYFIVRSMDEKILFHAADPTQEGRDMKGTTDILGRPYGRMFHETATNPGGEGWVHYMYPEPGSLFPIWKSTFVKRVDLPSGAQCILACGIYNMDMNESFIEDLVDRAAALLTARGKDAFAELRDKKGPYVFLNTYVFVDDPTGTELVNPAQPSLQGKNLIGARDVRGKLVVRDYIAAALDKGSTWVDYYWYKPGQNTPAYKRAYVRKVMSGDATYIVGSGFYPRENNVAPLGEDGLRGEDQHLRR